jgi:hypothetical protein
MTLQIKRAVYLYTHNFTNEVRERYAGRVHLVPAGSQMSFCRKARGHAGRPIRWESPQDPGHVTCEMCRKKLDRMTLKQRFSR